MKPESKELAPNWWDWGLCPITGFITNGEARERQQQRERAKAKKEALKQKS